jgi:hypothetical protein
LTTAFAQPVSAQVEHGDAVTGLQAGGTQPGHRPLHTLAQLQPGAAGVAEDDRGGVGLLGGPAGQHVGEIGMVGNHRVSCGWRVGAHLCTAPSLGS